jgi:CRISPR-associated protein Cas2
VWLLVMFDLPVVTIEQRRSATAYRHLLLDRGFSRVQLSVYSRYMINATATIPVIGGLKASVPAEGYVRILQLSDHQWARGWHLFGSKYVEPEAAPDQIVLF